MPKTNWSTGMIITPEFLNKIGSPTWSQTPDEDGEFLPPALAAMPDVKAAIDLYPQSANYVLPEAFPNSALNLRARIAVGSFWECRDLTVSIVRFSAKVFDVSLFSNWSGSVPASTEPVDFELTVPNPTGTVEPKVPLLTDLINARTSVDSSDVIAYGFMSLACPESSIGANRSAFLHAFKAGSGAYSPWSLRITSALPMTWAASIGGGTEPALHARFLVVIP